MIRKQRLATIDVELKEMMDSLKLKPNSLVKYFRMQAKDRLDFGTPMVDFED